jgi:hypothetical protein
MLEQVHDLVLAHLLGRGDQSPGRTYLEMLYFYHRGVDRAVAQVFVLRLLHDLLGFAHQPLGDLVRRSLGLLAELLEDLLDCPYLRCFRLALRMARTSFSNIGKCGHLINPSVPIVDPFATLRTRGVGEIAYP